MGTEWKRGLIITFQEVFRGLALALYSTPHPNYIELLTTYTSNTHYYLLLEHKPYRYNKYPLQVPMPIPLTTALQIPFLQVPPW